MHAGHRNRAPSPEHATLEPIVRHPARYFEKGAWDSVTCRLCPHYCSIAPSRSGACGVRSNRGGELYSDSYGKFSVAEAVTAEQLPLFEYKPCARWLRIGTRGCTMRCPFCNTYKCSQVGGIRTRGLMPRDAVEEARNGGCEGISFGVNEPAQVHEYAADTFAEAIAAGMMTHLATGGMWSNGPLREILPSVTAVTFGLKGASPEYYQKNLGGVLEVIFDNIETAIALGCHVEISWLAIPGQTDSAEQAANLLRLLAKSDTKPPILLIPYEPDFAWKNSTQAAGLDHLHALQGHFAGYEGNVYELHNDSAEHNTRCRKCGRVLVRRGLSGLIGTPLPTRSGHAVCPGCNAPVHFTP